MSITPQIWYIINGIHYSNSSSLIPIQYGLLHALSSSDGSKSQKRYPPLDTISLFLSCPPCHLNQSCHHKLSLTLRNHHYSQISRECSFFLCIVILVTFLFIKPNTFCKVTKILCHIFFPRIDLLMGGVNFFKNLVTLKSVSRQNGEVTKQAKLE